MKNRIKFFLLWLLAAYSLPAQSNLLWERRFNVPPFTIETGSPYTYNARVQTDPDRNVITAASMAFYTGTNLWNGFDSTDIVVLKYDPNGNLLWTTFFHCPSDSDDLVRDMLVDTAGNIYITGAGYDANFRKGILTLKLDPNGNVLWYRLESSNTFNIDEGRRICMDHNGDLMIGAQIDDPSNTRKVALYKYTASGTFLGEWIPDSLSSNGYLFSDLEISPTGDYLLGASDSQNHFISLFRYTAAGSPVFNQTFSTHNEYELCAVDVDGNDNIYLAGCVNGSTSLDYLVMKLDASGTLIWYRTYNGALSYPDVAHDIKADGNGNVYVSGLDNGYWTQASALCTIAYNAQGQQLWVARCDTSDDNHAKMLFKDRFDRVYAAGRSEAGYTGGHALICRQYDINGPTNWFVHYAHQNGNGMINDPHDIYVDDSLYVYIVGCSVDTAGDLLVLKYAPSQNPESVSHPDPVSPVVIFPNPAANSLFIGGTGTLPLTIGLYDARGRLVLEQQTIPGEQVSLSSVAAGAYLCVIREGEELQLRQKLLITR